MAPPADGGMGDMDALGAAFGAQGVEPMAGPDPMGTNPPPGPEGDPMANMAPPDPMGTNPPPGPKGIQWPVLMRLLEELWIKLWTKALVGVLLIRERHQTRGRKCQQMLQTLPQSLRQAGRADSWLKY